MPARAVRIVAGATLALALAWTPAARAEGGGIRVKFLKEEVDPVWNVAGHPIVGVSLPPAAGTRRDLSIWAGPLGGAPGERVFCVDLVSRDADYRGRAEVVVDTSGALPGAVPLVAASAYPGQLREIDAAALALHIAKGDCASADAGEPDLVVGGWASETGPMPPPAIDILVNARAGEAAVSLSTPDGTAVGSTACTEVEEPRRTGYDFRCRVALDVPPGTSSLEGLLRRRTDGIRLPSAAFRISFE